ncbi:hypothetical protein MJG53_017256 [Ovis ammon polii x Ovis aries]|uniref:Uncharacterized protein n=1 Tax=Ovis ammon polii x Ovis aries TaxID=2918886 RepID=A0ACB9U7R5_9CETA|nr:hypothetical protein MJG53_017256 [Ovis ammon polii x Ovis aries]
MLSPGDALRRGRHGPTLIKSDCNQRDRQFQIRIRAWCVWIIHAALLILMDGDLSEAKPRVTLSEERLKAMDFPEGLAQHADSWSSEAAAVGLTWALNRALQFQLANADSQGTQSLQSDPRSVASINPGSATHEWKMTLAHLGRQKGSTSGAEEHQENTDISVSFAPAWKTFEYCKLLSSGISPYLASSPYGAHWQSSQKQHLFEAAAGETQIQRRNWEYGDNHNRQKTKD